MIAYIIIVIFGGFLFQYQPAVYTTKALCSIYTYTSNVLKDGDLVFWGEWLTSRGICVIRNIIGRNKTKDGSVMSS